MSKSNNVTSDKKIFFEQLKIFKNIFYQQNNEWNRQEIENK